MVNQFQIDMFWDWHGRSGISRRGNDMSVRKYIADNLLMVELYGIRIKEPSIEELLMMKELIQREINDYFIEGNQE